MYTFCNRIVILSKQFPAKHQIETVAFDPTGEVIGKSNCLASIKLVAYDNRYYLYNYYWTSGVGFTDGQLFILDALSLDNKHDGTFQYSRDGITKIVFSSNSQYLATAVCVIIYLQLSSYWLLLS